MDEQKLLRFIQLVGKAISDTFGEPKNVDDAVRMIENSPIQKSPPTLLRHRSTALYKRVWALWKQNKSINTIAAMVNKTPNQISQLLYYAKLQLEPKPRPPQTKESPKPKPQLCDEPKQTQKPIIELNEIRTPNTVKMFPAEAARIKAKIDAGEI